MDWDGIGTLGLFIGSGGVGMAFIAFRAYKAKLAAQLESERIRHSDTHPDDVLDQVRNLETQVQRLTQRIDFTEGLIGKGQSEPVASQPEDV